MQTDLDRLKAWIGTYPGHDILGRFSVDYTDQIPGNGGIFPSGLLEIGRKSDILGNMTVRNQYNFGLYYVLTKSPEDLQGAEANAEWLMDFQRWVQDQSVRHLAPTFGDEPRQEQITAQNGSLYGADEEGTAMYMVQLSVKFTKHYTR